MSYTVATTSLNLSRPACGPKKVTRSALQTPPSIAALLLTTECLSPKWPENEKPAYGGPRPWRRNGRQWIPKPFLIRKEPKKKYSRSRPGNAASLFFYRGADVIRTEFRPHRPPGRAVSFYFRLEPLPGRDAMLHA